MTNKLKRWEQRFQNFNKAFKLLERTISIKEPNEAEIGGLIQFYETAFELAWKTLKDFLEAEGFIIKSPRETIKQAFQIGLIDNGEKWLEALDDRNLTPHIYDEKIAQLIVIRIRNNYFLLIKDIHSFFQEKINGLRT